MVVILIIIILVLNVISDLVLNFDLTLFLLDTLLSKSFLASLKRASKVVASNTKYSTFKDFIFPLYFILVFSPERPKVERMLEESIAYLFRKSCFAVFP